MSSLDQLIKELCPNGVKYKKLGELLRNNNASNSVSKNDYMKVGQIPIIDQSQAYISGYTDNKSAIPPIIPCIIFGDHTRVVKYANQKFAQGYSGTKVFIPVSEKINTKYIYYVFCNIDIPSRGYNRHWSIVKDITVPLPPIPIQEEIVRILDNFTEHTAELTAELTARRKQYEYYRDKLLTFGNEVEWKQIQDICINVTSGGTPHTSNKECYSGNIPWLRTQEVDFLDIYDTGVKITQQGLNESSTKWIPENCVIVAMYGATAAKSAINKIPLTTNQACCNLEIDKNKALYKYVFYWLSNQYHNLKSMGRGSQSNINGKIVKEYPIPIPPLSEQERIVSILDKFDALVNDISIGIPAEIEARKKQYEYYRDKLLTFKELDA